jgi:hypothetical protein
MKTIVVIFCVMLAAGSASAQGVYNIAKQQARNVANGAPPQGEPPPPSAPPQNNTPPPAPANPVLEATLQNISNLRIDFDALGKVTDLKPDAPQKKLLLTDLTAAAQGTKPTDTAIASLADGFAAAVAGKDALKPHDAKLAQEVHAVFNASHLSDAQRQKIFDDIQKILTDGGVSADDAINVVSRLKTIATETGQK